MLAAIRSDFGEFWRCKFELGSAVCWCEWVAKLCG